MASSNFVSDAVSIKSLGINVRHHGKHPEYDDLIQIPTSHGQKAESSSKTSRTLLNGKWNVNKTDGDGRCG